MERLNINRERLGRLAVEAAEGFLSSTPHYSTGDTRYAMFQSFLWLQGIDFYDYDKTKLDVLAGFFRKVVALRLADNSYATIGTYVLGWIDMAEKSKLKAISDFSEPYGYDFEGVLAAGKKRHSFNNEHDPFMIYPIPDSYGKDVWYVAELPEQNNKSFPKDARLVYWNNGLLRWVVVETAPLMKLAEAVTDNSDKKGV